MVIFTFLTDSGLTLSEFDQNFESMATTNKSLQPVNIPAECECRDRMRPINS